MEPKDKGGKSKAAVNTATLKDSGEFRSGNQVKTALIRGNNFAAKPVQYVVRDGLAIFEGDIVLGTADEVQQLSDQIKAEQQSGAIEMGVAISGAQFRWPNCRIPFTIDPALPNQARVTDAIAHWESVTRFRFVARAAETDFVTFRPGSGCSSSVGRRGGQQFVNLAATCSTGNAIHEIGHVVGLWHEQSREDRDMFVTIHWDKITSGLEHNFNQHITDGDDIGAYDYGSIMHYPRDAFSVDGSDTITPVNPAQIGQRIALSAGDIAAVNSFCRIIKRFDTRKELIKDLRLDTRKEMIRDTVKEGAFDPLTTLAENIRIPGQPQILTGPLIGGAQPFAVMTPHQKSAAAGSGSDMEQSISQLDAQLQDLSEYIAQADANKEALQAQYNETATLLQQLLQEHDDLSGK